MKILFIKIQNTGKVNAPHPPPPGISGAHGKVKGKFKIEE